MPRRCRYCREYNIPKSAPKEDAFCTHEHKVAYAMAVVNKSRQQRAKVEKKKQAQQKQELKINDHRHQVILTKKAAQRLAVLLDSGYGCISCGNTRDVQYCGGHFKTAGAHPELAVDLRNIHKQCNRYCNLGLSGNIAGNKNSAGYRAGLISRYGAAFVEALESHQGGQRLDHLPSVRKTYNAEIRRLEKGLPPSKDWRALPQVQEQQAA